MIRLPLALLCSLAVGQTPPGAAEKGSIGGLVRDANTGAPVADANVSAGLPGARGVQATTDVQGRFTLRNVDPGTVQLSASGPRIQGAPFPLVTRKFITLLPGQEVESIQVAIRTSAQISGQITDQNGQPVPDTTVTLIAREYQSGQVRYIYAAAGRSDDQGKYTIAAQPGRTYLAMAAKAAAGVAAIADAPADPALRRKSVVPTYYPGVTTPDGAQAFKLASGEKRENIDIRLQRAESYCAEGSLQAGGAPAALRFTYSEAYPHSGNSGEGGLFMSGFNGTAGPDGKIRVCDLHPGQYRFIVSAAGTGALSATTSFGVGMATITDRDAAIVFTATPLMEIQGEVAWAESPLENVAWPANWFLQLQPISRTIYPPEPSATPLPQPGSAFTLKLFMDDFNVRFPAAAPAGTYVKAVLYGDTEVRRTGLHPGSAVGDARLRVMMAHDGGTLRARVADKDGNPMADHFVIAFPNTAIQEAELAEAVVTGQTDQNGAWTSPSIAPGKYYVFAGRTPFDRSPETLTALLRARQQAKQSDVAAKSRVDVSLEPFALE